MMDQENAFGVPTGHSSTQCPSVTPHKFAASKTLRNNQWSHANPGGSTYVVSI